MVWLSVGRRLGVGTMLSAVLLASGCATVQKATSSLPRFPQLSENQTRKTPAGSLASNGPREKTVMRISDHNSEGVAPASYQGPAKPAAAPCPSGDG